MCRYTNKRTPVPEFPRIGTHPNDFELVQPFQVIDLPARRFWDIDYLKNLPGVMVADPRPGARPRDWWWTGDGGQAGAWWVGYESAWLPASLLREKNQSALVDAWFEASRHFGVSFHFNKGLAGATPQTLAASRDTSINPEVLDAFALAIIANERHWEAPDLAVARNIATRIKASMTALRKAAPTAGSYLSECNYFAENWQQASWGKHYQRLKRIKRRYDPDGLFIVHHGVGSEDWSADGFALRSE